MSRTRGGAEPLDKAAVLEFFEARAARFDEASPLVSVLYQDKHPDLVIERDAAEKAAVLPLLALSIDSLVLDVGCGVGRWAPEVRSAGAGYVGTDISPSLIDHARRLHPEIAEAFHALSATETDHLTVDDFTHVLMAGVAMYLDDGEFRAALEQVADVCASSAVVYLREVLTSDARLTLRHEWSSDMDMEYHATYRGQEESAALVAGVLEPRGFRLVEAGSPVPAHLANRSDTFQRFTLWRR